MVSFVYVLDSILDWGSHSQLWKTRTGFCWRGITKSALQTRRPVLHHVARHFQNGETKVISTKYQIVEIDREQFWYFRFWPKIIPPFWFCERRTFHRVVDCQKWGAMSNKLRETERASTEVYIIFFGKQQHSSARSTRVRPLILTAYHPIPILLK